MSRTSGYCLWTMITALLVIVLMGFGASAGPAVYGAQKVLETHDATTMDDMVLPMRSDQDQDDDAMETSNYLVIDFGIFGTLTMAPMGNGTDDGNTSDPGGGNNGNGSDDGSGKDSGDGSGDDNGTDLDPGGGGGNNNKTVVKTLMDPGMSDVTDNSVNPMMAPGDNGTDDTDPGNGNGTDPGGKQEPVDAIGPGPVGDHGYGLIEIFH